MTKKGLTSSNLFSLIQGIIIIGLLLFFGFKYFGDLFNQEEIIEKNQLKETLQNSINSMSSKYGSSKINLFKVNSNYNEICFINTTDKTKLPSTFVKNYPLISNAIEIGENVFLMGENYYPIKVDKLQVESSVLCIPIKNGNFKINIEGKGEGSLISSIHGVETEINIPEGETSKNIVLSSLDYAVELNIPQGTIINYPAGSEKKINIIKKTSELPTNSLNVVSQVYDFKPEGITFNKKIPITLTIDFNLIDDVDKLKIYYSKDSGWVELGGNYEIDIDAKTITGYTDHFTEFMAANVGLNNQQQQKATDIFLIMGQSNSVGFGTEAPAIVSVNNAYEIDFVGGTNKFLPLSYPTGAGSGNQYLSKKSGFSLSLAKKWNELSNKELVFVFAGVPSTSLIESADSGSGDWTDETDNDGHYDYAIRLLNNAKLRINNDNNREIGKIIIVWLQGETEALEGISKDQYILHMNKLHQRLNQDAQFDAFFVVSIGYTSAQPSVNTQRFEAIMDAQKEFSNLKTNTILVSKKAAMLTSVCITNKNLPNCGLVDSFHYKARVYEELGNDIAINGWNFIVNGKTNNNPIDEPNLGLKCSSIGNENLIINYYKQYCFRCSDIDGLNYWVGKFNSNENTLEEIESTISDSCNNLLSKTKCERERFNADLVQCSNGYDYLSNNNVKCSKECVEGCISNCPIASSIQCGTKIPENCGNSCGTGTKCDTGTCINNICKYNTNVELNCNDNSNGAKLYKTYANRCGEDAGINYWNTQGANAGSFINAYKDYCLNTFSTNDIDICNNKMLCGNDEYEPNTNWCIKEN